MGKKSFLLLALAALIGLMLLAIGFGSVDISFATIITAMKNLIRNGVDGIDLTDPIHFISQIYPIHPISY